MESTDQTLTKKERHELRRQEKLAARESGDKKRKTASVMLWSCIIVFVAGTIALMVWGASKNPTAQFIGGAVKAADDSDWIKGAPLKDTRVTLIEYSDFQCPACGAYYPMVKQLGQEFKNLSIVYRHFPLPQHANARPAAQAAEAAGQQGKFWEMHDIVFDNQNSWAGSKSVEEVFIAYA
ncbi:MAG: thioredoxin domain-containing protein, partial [Patescibacteria group bacterium]